MTIARRPLLQAVFIVGWLTLWAHAGEKPPGEKPHWSYSGESGPAQWGELREDFVTCKTGSKQSPIDIVPTAQVKRPPVGLRYFGQTASIVNNGYAIQVNVTHGNSMSAGEREYQLRQFHFHSPGEHRVRGEEFALEAHFVHRGAAGEIAVVAVLFREGAADASIEKILSKIPSEVGKSEPLQIGMADLGFIPYQRAYYGYEGSLTTPPCTEGVHWFVLKSTATVSAAQVEAFASATGKNARPIQPTNDRTVTE